MNRLAIGLNFIVTILALINLHKHDQETVSATVADTVHHETYETCLSLVIQKVAYFAA